MKSEIKAALIKSRPTMHAGKASPYLKSLRQILVIQESALDDGQPVSALLINRTLVEHAAELRRNGHSLIPELSADGTGCLGCGAAIGECQCNELASIRGRDGGL